MVEQESRMEKKKREIKRHILEVCEQLFVFEKSFENVTMREIAQRAGVSVGSLYLHYRTREDILTTIISEFLKRHLEQMRAILEVQPSGITKLTRLFDYFCDMSADPYVTVFARIQLSYITLPKILKTESSSTLRMLLGDLVDLVEEILSLGQKDHTLYLCDSPKMAANTLMRLMISLFQSSGMIQNELIPLPPGEVDPGPAGAFLMLKKYLLRSFFP